MSSNPRSCAEIVCAALCLCGSTAVGGIAGCGDDGTRADGSGSNGIISAGLDTGDTEPGQGTGATGGDDQGTADGGSDDDAGNGIPLFDVGPTVGEDVCGGAGAGIGEDFTYIWIANSPEGTISKINTQTLVEEGRYVTRDTFGNPSRTSVALSGHMAVGNRSGGVTKYYAYDCPDPINTSTGPGDVYPFGMDGCMAWSTNMAYNSQRPVAWTPGTFNETTCEWENEYVWTSGYNGGGSVDAIRLDGETGVILDMVTVNGINSDSFGAYGGASDSQGNFWFSQLGVGRLVRVPIADPTAYEVWPMPISGYGMAVDNMDRAWICGSGVARFDYGTQTFDTSNATGGGAAGCMADATHIWLAGGSNVRGVNLATMNLDFNWPIPSYIHGTSIDFDGNVWGASRDTRAYRVHPTIGTVDTVDGLNSPYTYSDMTGYGLANSVGPQG